MRGVNLLAMLFSYFVGAEKRQLGESRRRAPRSCGANGVTASPRRSAEFGSTLLLAVVGLAMIAEMARAVEFTADVAPVLTKYCAGCHNAQERAGKLSLESHAALSEGLPDGPLLLPGNAKSSRIIRVLTGLAEPTMPPERESRPTDDEIARIEEWIDAGALGPDGNAAVPRLITPDIPSAVVGDAQAITAIGLSPDGTQLAIGRLGRVDLLESVLQVPVRSIVGLPGKIHSLNYSPTGESLVVAIGVPGLNGRADFYRTSDGELIRSFIGHRDAMYDAEIDPTGKILATCSYDKTIIVWDAASGVPLRTISGHHGAVFDIAFSPDGAVLASASADETVKLWDPSTGERLDTLGQPEGEQYCVAFSPDGTRLAAGGADKRIRVWQFSRQQNPRDNPLLFTRFAHEESVVALTFSLDGRLLASSANDRTLKIWETDEFANARLMPLQSDVATTLAIAPSSDRAVVGRMDGTWSIVPLEPVSAAAPSAVQKVGVSLTGEGLVPANGSSPRDGAVPPATAETNELESNDARENATPIALPALVRGRIERKNVVANDGTTMQGDVDLYRVIGKAHEPLFLETIAARNGSPLDAKIEVLDAKGDRVPRVLLQAVAESYFTFRGKNSRESGDFRLHNWEAMDLNQYLYARGEVVKLWFYPRGPDSGFLTYPGEGDRYSYFDTTSVAHAVNEPCWIVEPHPPGSALTPNGLPNFTIYYENDDDSRREAGADARLTFVPPANGDYFVRVSDARGFGGENFWYELSVRPLRPDFEVRLELPQETIPVGSGRELRAVVTRKEGFDGEVRVDIAGLPAGFAVTTPLVIEAGQNVAWGTITALANAVDPGDSVVPLQVSATAQLGSAPVRKEVAFATKLKLGEAPRFVAWIVRASAPSDTNSVDGLSREGAANPIGVEQAFFVEHPLELTLAPGETISATVRVERRGDFDEEVSFGGEGAGRNLPHGVYVADIGLNGLLVARGTEERAFFITAAPWAPETSRLFHLKARLDGELTTLPVLLHVRPRTAVAELDRGAVSP